MRLRWLLWTLLGAGCGVGITSHPLNTPAHPMRPRSASEVEMFTTSKPTYAYVEVAVLEARQESQFSVANTEEVFDTMRNRAAEMGCDGLLLLGSADEVVGGTYNGQGSTRTLHGYRGTCIVHADGSGPPPAAAGVALGSTGSSAITAGDAVVRTGPSNAAPELVKLPAGSRLAAMDSTGGEWRRVRLEDGRYGFVLSTELRAAPAAAAPTPAHEAAPAPAAAPVSTPEKVASPYCDPPCSPGYACQAGICVALCNPTCGPDQVCGGDRICRKR
jgi:hypothetical protein